MLQGIVKQLLVRSKLGCGKGWQESPYAAQVLWSSCKGGWSCLFSFYSRKWILPPTKFPKKGMWSHRKGIWILAVKTKHNKQTKPPTNNVPHTCMEITFYIMKSGYLETLFNVYFSDINIKCPKNQSTCSHN